MFLKEGIIQKESRVADIVSNDYRTAEVFQRYGIEYCCGGKWPLETVCMMKGIDLDEIQAALHQATRPLHLPATMPFEQWSVDFLADYIMNIHHHYLRQTLPTFLPVISRFVEEHTKKYPQLHQLQGAYHKLQKEIIPHIEEEESTIFPYIRQLAHAYEDKDPYARLLVKTMRKPIDKMMGHEHVMVSDLLQQFRQLTSYYTPPEKACTSHKVVFSKLKELDNDLSQHVWLENQVLFPKALAMEKDILNGYH
jgi:regulator of cell morphogenesis and NO signaling